MAVTISVLACLGAGLLWLVSLTWLAGWLLWLSWWLVAVIATTLAVVVVLNPDKEFADGRLQRLSGCLLGGLVTVAALWGQDSFHDYLLAPSAAGPVADVQDVASTSPPATGSPDPMEEAQADLRRLEDHRAAVEDLLDRTRDERAEVVSRLRQLGVETVSDLKNHARGPVLAGEFQRLTAEIDGLDREVARIDEGLVKARALIRSLKRSQVLGEAGLSEEELKEFSARLMLADEAEAGESPSTPPDPVRTDALLQEELARAEADENHGGSP